MPTTTDDGNHGSGASTADVLTAIRQNIEKALTGIVPTPDAVSARAADAVAAIVEQFHLVPRREFEHHLELLQRLETRVAELEAQLADTSSDG